MKILARVIGLIIFAVGVVLVIFAVNSTQAPLEKIMEQATGRYSSETMWYIIGGVIAIIAGGAIALFGPRDSH